jgi:hypothetical protein
VTEDVDGEGDADADAIGSFAVTNGLIRHENIIAILDILRPRNIEDFKEVYLIQVCLSGQSFFHLAVFLAFSFATRVVRGQELTFAPVSSVTVDLGIDGDRLAQSDQDARAQRRSLSIFHLPSESASLIFILPGRFDC